MERSASLSERLAIEKQLLAEEKFLVDAMKKVLEGQHSLQVERLQIMSMIHNLQKEACPQPAPRPPAAPPQFMTAKFDPPSLDDEDLINVLDLNLTVPQHSFHEREIEDQEEDDYEIEIGMLMNMKTNKN